MAVSQTDIMPRPPPIAVPLIRPISGLSRVLRACSMCASIRASAIRVARSAANCARIQSRSPPAQKLFPAPVRITARMAAVGG